MPIAKEITFVSEADYLAGELITYFKNEYLNRHVYAMAEENANHNLLAGNILTALSLHLKGKSLQTYSNSRYE